MRHEEKESLNKWLARLGRLLAVGIVVYAFDPGVSGYREGGPFILHFDASELEVLESLVLKLHPELADDAKARKYLEEAKAQEVRECEEVGRRARRAGVRTCTLGLISSGYIVRGWVWVRRTERSRPEKMDINGRGPSRMLALDRVLLAVEQLKGIYVNVGTAPKRRG